MNSRFDESVPVMLFQVGRYPFVYGTLGAVRSLGRVGVPAHACVRSRLVPHRYSRYLSQRFRAPIDVGVDQNIILQHLLDHARSCAKPIILVPTDDEAAVFSAEQANNLRPFFILPEVAVDLPSILASKRGLFDLCALHKVPTPATVFARSRGDVLALAATARYPVVVKNSEPWSRISEPAVSSTTIVRSQAELLAMVERWPTNPRVIVQEYIPGEVAEDWIVHAYCGGNGTEPLGFTGRKHRSWPPGVGVTTAATAMRNDELLALALQFCRAIGYRGIADMDWRLDRRDGTYKLLDFNPRLGANFRLFVTEHEIDVVRALHLDLTGREIPRSPQRFGRRFRVENLDWASRLSRSRQSAVSPGKYVTEYAWYASDDPLPFFVMALRFLHYMLGRMLSGALTRARSIVHHGRIPVRRPHEIDSGR
jgi:D-aspartate ligase